MGIEGGRLSVKGFVIKLSNCGATIIEIGSGGESSS